MPYRDERRARAIPPMLWGIMGLLVVGAFLAALGMLHGLS
jgi:hypothetical protein